MATTDPHRSRIMRAVKGKDTKPELVVRRLVYSLGFRYRLHLDDLPGSPDLVFKARRKVIFVHGCFWHGHDCKRGARQPKTNSEYWLRKINRNRERDEVVQAKLTSADWDVLVIWECEVHNPYLADRIVGFLSE